MKWWTLIIIIILLLKLLYIIFMYRNMKRTNKVTREYYNAKINEIGKESIIDNIPKIYSSI